MTDTEQKSPVFTCDNGINRQWLMECVNEGWIKFDTEKDKNRFIHLVRDMAPPVTPRSNPEEQCINRQEAIDAFQIFREYESNRSSGEWVDRIETVLNHLQPVTPRSDSEDIAKAFQLGLAIGFGERYDELDKVIDEIKKLITPQSKIEVDI